MNQDASIPISTEASAKPDLSIRVGSPFASEPNAPERRSKRIEAFYDVGPIRYTAMGSVGASVMVLGFAAAGAWWFPVGGVLIAALGCGLSLFGMASVYRISSITLLLIHLGLFLFSYSRSFS